MKKLVLLLLLFITSVCTVKAQAHLTDPDYLMALRSLENARKSALRRDVITTLTHLGRAQKRIKKVKKKYPDADIDALEKEKKAINKTIAKLKAKKKDKEGEVSEEEYVMSDLPAAEESNPTLEADFKTVAENFISNDLMLEELTVSYVILTTDKWYDDRDKTGRVSGRVREACVVLKDKKGACLFQMMTFLQKRIDKKYDATQVQDSDDPIAIDCPAEK